MVLWLLVLVSMAFGQVNNERLGQRDPAEGVGIQLGVGGAAASGNLSQVSLTGDLAAQYRRYYRPEDAPPTLEGAKWTISMTIDLQLRYDSEPPGDLARLDTRVTWGLRFRFAARPDAEPAHARASTPHQGLAS